MQCLYVDRTTTECMLGKLTAYGRLKEKCLCGWEHD